MMFNRKRIIIAVIIAVAFIAFSTAMLYSGMDNSTEENGIKPSNEWESHWPNSVFYEIFVGAYSDSNGDGIGDINGMTEKLDYLTDLGVEGIWLMPINPSPSYHKYDVTDYYSIDPQYGTLDDFKNFLDEAHKRDIKVIMDLVVNHTSKDHPWFQEALSSPDSAKRDWYIFADEQTNLNERGEWNQQVWHGYRENKYYGLFWEGMPDLNFDNPEVREEMIKIGKYWLEDIGVDGFRLDAAKHIYKEGEGEKNIVWWQEFSEEMHKVDEDVFLVGEVWDSPSITGSYMQDGLTSTFNFDLSSKIISAVEQEKDTGIVNYLERVREYYASMDEDYIDSIFLTNHDMDRVMSQLDGDINHAKMAASILLTLPGTPFIYYGEEIGMQGKKPDEYIREPMNWYIDPKGTSQTTWISSRYNRGENATSVEAQFNDENSLYNHYKSLIHLRRSQDVLTLGEIESSSIKETGTIAYKRVYNDDSVLVIHNLTKETKTIVLSDEENKYENILFTTENSNEVIVKDKQTEINIKPYSTIILSEK